MSYVSTNALITAKLAIAGASTPKTAFSTDLIALQDEIATQSAEFSEASALEIEKKLLELADTIGNVLRDVS